MNDRGSRALTTVPPGRTTEHERGREATAFESSSVSQRANAIRSYNTVTEVSVTFRKCF